MPFSTYLPEQMGSIKLTPSGPFVAGSHAELTLTYTAGTFGIDDTGMVKISWRTTSDMSKPQFDRPTAPNFTTVEASNGAMLEVWFDRLNIRPWANTLLIRIGRGYLRAGDTLTVRMGDRRQGSPGFRLQTNCEERVELKTSIDAFATYEFCELPEQPAFALVPGPAAQLEGNLALARASSASRSASRSSPRTCGATRPRRPSEIVTLVPSRPVRGLPQSIAIKRGERPARARKSRRRRSGRSRTATHGERPGARAAPIRMRVVTKAPLRRYWGDLHGQSGETIGMGSAESYFRYARDAAFIDIVGHQGNDFQITDAFWAELNRLTARIRRARSFRLPAGLRMVGQYRHGRRPQHFLPARRPPHPPLVAYSGRRPDLDRCDLHRR